MPSFEEFMGGKENAEAFRKTGHAIKHRAKLSLEEVFKRMPWDQVFDLSGGEQAEIKKFVEPRVKNGHLEFGFDVRDTLGAWHIEFFVTQTGWGGKPVNTIEIKRDDVGS